MKRASSALALLAALAAAPSPECPAQDFRYFRDTTINTTFQASDLCYNPLRGKMYCTISDTALGVIDSLYNYSTVSGFNWSYPRHPEFNRGRDLVYVTGTYRVFMIDGQTNAIVDSTETLSEGFNDLLYDSISNRLYVAGMGLSILDGTSDALLKHYPNYDLQLFHYRPSDKIFAQHNYSNDSLLVVRDTARLAEVQVPGMDYQSRFAANEARGKIYVSIPGTNRVVIMDAATHSITNTVGVAARPGAMAYCPATDEIYVACQYSDSLTVIRGSDDSVSTVYLGAAGDSVTAIIYNAFLGRIYCADQNSGTVAIVNPATKTVEAAVSLTAAGPSIPVALEEGSRGKVYAASDSWLGFVSVVAWEDTTYPYIMWTAPYDSAADVSFDDPVTVYFSEAIDPASLSFTCSPDPGGWTAEWDSTQRLLTLWHSYFVPNTQHAFTITEARDPWGNQLVGGLAPNPWHFTVRALEAVWHPWQRGVYRLVSLPLQPYDSTAVGSFGDDLGAYGPSGWRLFGYDPASSSNVETPPLTLGRGYWLSSVNSCTLDASGYRLPNQGSSHVVHLGQGWNLVGDPFGVPVPMGNCEVMGPASYLWSDSLSNNLLRQRAWVYTDSTQDFRNNGGWDLDTLSPANPGDSLTPWGGYAVWATAPCSLLVMTPIADSPRPPAAPAAPASIDWRLAVTAASGGETDRVALGISPQALPAYDRLDGEKPPPVSETVRLNIPHGDWGPGTWHQYASDFRPDGDHVEWPLALSLADQSAEAAVSFRLEGSLPEGQKLYLVEGRERRAVEIANGMQAGFTGDRELAVVLSNRGPGELPFVPMSFDLGSPRPNPSSRMTRIDYQIVRPGPVRLAVYNALGQRVRTIVHGPKPPGYYTASWDGRDDRMAQAPPGVYFVRLEAEGRQATRRLVRVR